MSDQVNQPRHYTVHPSGVECIQITEHMGFCLGNAIKYVWRAGQKGEALEDLKKARWYIDREIQRLEKATVPVEEPEPVTQAAPKPAVLKVGDRVKVRSPDDYYDEIEGEVVMIGDDDFVVRLDVDDAEFFFAANELELVEPFKAGARVRLIHPSGWAGAEGTVKELLPEGWAHVQINENIGFTTPCAWMEPV